MLEEKNNSIYLSIVNGEIQRWMGKGKPVKTYGKVGGHIVKVTTENKSFDGKETRFILLQMADGEERYSVQVPMYGGAGPDILRCLAYAIRNGMNIVNGDVVSIQAYSRVKDGKTFTNATVYYGNNKLEWLLLPNGMKREDGLNQLFDEIAAYVNNATTSSESPVPTPDEPFHTTPFDNRR